MAKPKPPTPPDPQVTSAAQTNSNVTTAKSTAALDAVNQVSPFGSVNYDITGSRNVDGHDIPQYTQTTTLSPGQQQLYDKQTGVTNQAYDAAGQAIGQAQNVLSSPFSLNNLPPMGQAPNAPQLQTGFNYTDPQFGFQGGGPIQNNVGTTGQRTQFGGAGQIPLAAQAVGQQTGVNGGGPIRQRIGKTGQLTGLDSAGQIQSGLDFNGLPQLPGANDFSAERRRVEDASMSRFNEDFGGQQEQARARLNAQGLQEGSAAWNESMKGLDRSRNDALAQAQLLGGQEQSRLFGLASQARGQLAGERTTAGNFGLNAQGQQFGQNLAGGQFTNQALENQFGQNLQAGQYGLQAQGQQYGQNLSQGQFTNQALQNIYGQTSGAAGQQAGFQQQAYGQQLGRGQFENDARQNAYAQALSSGQFTNQAQGQLFGQNAAQADFYNQAANQQYGQNQGAAAFGNTAQQQNFGNQMQSANLQSQNRQQSIAEQQLMRSLPLNEVAMLLGLGPGMQMPTGAPNFGVNVGNTNVLDAYGQQQAGQWANYNAKAQQNAALWNGIGSMAGTAAMMSDARTKNIIKRVGQTDSGIPLYLFTYKMGGPPQIGVMAQEAQKVRPEAVFDVDGTLFVDYARVA